MNFSAGFKKNIHNTAWMIGGRIVKMGLQFLIGIAIARYLGPRGFGDYNFAISLVMMVSILSNLGLNHMMIREFSESPDQSGVYLGTCFGLKFSGGIVAFLLLLYLVQVMGLDFESQLLVLVYGSSLIFQSLNMIGVYFESLRQSKYLMIAELAQAVIFFALKGACILIGKSVLWFISIQATEWLLISLFLYLFQYRRNRNFFRTWKFNGRIAVHLLKESWPFIFAGAAAMIYQRVDQVMLRQMVSAEEVGYYSAAARFAIFLGIIPTLLVRSLTPSLVGAKKKSQELFLERNQLLNDLVFWSTLVCTLFITICSTWLIAFLYGHDYSKSDHILSVLAWKGIFTAMGVASGQFILLSGLQIYVPIRQGLGCILNVGLNIILIPIFGAIGAAWASLIASMVALFIAHLFIPGLRMIFYSQCKSILSGWRRLLQVILAKRI